MREIFILALAQFVLMPGQRHFARLQGQGVVATAWKFKDKADSILKSIKETLEKIENIFFCFIAIYETKQVG